MFSMEVLKIEKEGGIEEKEKLKIFFRCSDFKVNVFGTPFQKFFVVSEKEIEFKQLCEIGEVGKIYTVYEDFSNDPKDYNFYPRKFVEFGENVRAIVEISLVMEKAPNQEWMYEQKDDAEIKKLAKEKETLCQLYFGEKFKVMVYDGENEILLKIQSEIGQWNPQEKFYDFVRKVFF